MYYFRHAVKYPQPPPYNGLHITSTNYFKLVRFEMLCIALTPVVECKKKIIELL